MGLAAIGKKSVLQSSPTRGLEFFFPAKNPDLGAGLAGWRLLCRAGGAAGLRCRAGPNCWIRQQFRKKKILGRIPTLARAWQGSDAGQVARPGGYARQECGALGVGRARTQGEPSNEVGRASILIGRARTHWASPYSFNKPVLGEPSNEVGASHQTRLGEPVLRGRWASHQTRLGQAIKRGWASQYQGAVGRASTHWASPYSLGESVLLRLGRTRIGRTTQPLSQWPTPAPAWRCACSAHLQVPARHVYLSACSALQVPARHVRCLPTSARSARLLTSARSARLLTSARSALCLLGTFN